ncbi:MAG: DUF2334 domain-containing protein [Ruminococcaceae bacterium]|nr:DUF2334 domain-containing protein [Oscillospiraceae bacterium]
MRSIEEYFRVKKREKRLKICAFFLAISILTCFFVACTEEEEVSAKPRPNKNTTAKVDPNAKRVAITFDDGPHNVRTKQIVDELDKYGYNATFFVVGNRVDGKAYNGADALKYAHEKGNEIAIHGYTHAVYYHNCEEDRYQRELSNTFDAIKEVVPNAKVRLMRPIGGNITDQRVQNCKYSVIMWSVDSEDWKYKGRGENGEFAEQNINIIVENVMSKVKSGDIILMHDIYENTYEATKIILKRLHDEGYDVVSVSELLGNARAGVKYSRLST